MSVPTVSAGVPLGFLVAAREFGLDADALARAGDLVMDELTDPDARIPEEKLLRLLEALERQTEVPDFGLRLGKKVRPELLGAVGYVMASAENLLAAFESLTRFGRLVHEQVMSPVTLTERELRFGRALPPRYARMRHPTVNSLVGCLVLARTLTGHEEIVPLRVQLQHPRPSHGAQYDALFGCTVEFGAPETAIWFPASAAHLPLLRHDPALFAYLSRHAEALQRSLPPAEERLASRVKALVTDALRSGEATQAFVARRLALSERTLQRRLREEDTTFAELLEETRRELASLYLGERRLAVYEVALLLGYSEPSAFFRAFRRWTGTTPQEFRQHPAV